jgi:hypothetical protein
MSCLTLQTKQSPERTAGGNNAIEDEDEDDDEYEDD